MRLSTFAFILFVDQLTKFFISKILSINTSYKVTSFFDIVHIRNSGISFGMFSNVFPTYFISTVVGIIILLLIIWLLRTDNTIEKWGLIIVISGAAGNFIDRLIHNSSVIDFLYFHYKKYYWPAFNIADIAIALGVVILIVANYKSYKYKGDNE